MNLPFSGNPPLGPLPVQEPVDYFRDLFDDELLLRIVDESNKYALQIDINKPLGLTQAELKQFIGILYLMSIVRMPSQRDYWSQYLQYQRISSVMTIRRFEWIKRFLHCNDNNTMPKDCTDKLYKIRPIIDALKEKFRLFSPTELLCIDEQMVPFKGRSKLKQYNPQKPKKWGYKLYVLTILDGGLVYDFEVHTAQLQYVQVNQIFKHPGTLS